MRYFVLLALLAGCGESPNLKPTRVVCYSGGVVIFDAELQRHYIVTQGYYWHNKQGDVVFPPADCVYTVAMEPIGVEP